MTTIQAFYPLTSKNIDVIIKNNTSDTVYTGFDYSIEYYDGTFWNELPLDIICFLPLITFDLSKRSINIPIYGNTGRFLSDLFGKI